MSDYPMLISNKLHSFRNFAIQINGIRTKQTKIFPEKHTHELNMHGE